MKPLYIILAVVFIAVFVSAGVFLILTKNKGGADGASNFQSPRFAQEVESILDRKISLIASLISDPLIISEVKKFNKEHEDISSEEISALDEQWRASESTDGFVVSFLANKIAQKLSAFQERNPGFSEIFITDERGLNIGQTNKTSDYYQADEDWWVESYNSGEGKAFHGAIEFDESAQAEAISLYVPIYDTDTKTVIGVTKAVLSTAVIKAEL